MQETRSHFSWGSFVLGFFFIFTALIAFQNIGSSLLSVTIFYACSAILKGCYELVFRSRFKELTGIKTYFPIIVGVIDLFVGIFLLFNLDIGVTILPYIFAVWFIIDSLGGLFTLSIARSVSNSYFWFSLIINVLGIFVGAMLLFNPIASALTLDYLIGFWLLLFGIEELIRSFVQ